MLSFVSTIRVTKLKWRPLRPRLQKQCFPKLTAMWKKGCDACKKKSVRCHRKAAFHCKGKSQEVFRTGLNEIKYDNVDFKQHFCLQYHVAATENRHETNDTSSSGVPQVYRSWGQTQFKHS